MIVAQYRILAWREIPTQVQATDDDGGRVNHAMARWFMQEISRTAMREGLADTDAYLEEFEWSVWQEREGTADQVAEAVLAELAARLGRHPDGHTLRTVNGSIPESDRVR